MAYAEKTKVPVDKSMAEVRKILIKNGSEGVAIAETSENALVQFIFKSKSYKFIIKYPKSSDDDIFLNGKGYKRTLVQIENAIEHEKKRLWRAMVLYIKAAIEAHNNGIIDFKRSMMSHMMLPSGQTIYEKLENNIESIDVSPQFLLEQ